MGLLCALAQLVSDVFFDIAGYFHLLNCAGWRHSGTEVGSSTRISHSYGLVGILFCVRGGILLSSKETANDTTGKTQENPTICKLIYTLHNLYLIRSSFQAEFELLEDQDSLVHLRVASQRRIFPHSIWEDSSDLGSHQMPRKVTSFREIATKSSIKRPT